MQHRDGIKVAGISTDMPSLIGTGRLKGDVSTDMPSLIGAGRLTGDVSTETCRS
jgi:hypothetical protein